MVVVWFGVVRRRYGGTPGTRLLQRLKKAHTRMDREERERGKGAGERNSEVLSKFDSVVFIDRKEKYGVKENLQ